MKIQELLLQIQILPSQLLPRIDKQEIYSKLDLSIDNKELASRNLESFHGLSAYIEERRTNSKADILWGGYLEQRQIYAESDHFGEGENRRDIHLGIDFWADSGREIAAPIDGKIHSFQNNAGFRDYGPTIILQHEFHGFKFHSLYGHLSSSILGQVQVGDYVNKGEIFAEIGDTSENGNWPPHLHFQLIIDLHGKRGDFPGVCSKAELEMMNANCPDPSHLILL